MLHQTEKTVDVHYTGESESSIMSPPCTRFNSSALPKDSCTKSGMNVQIGVSTRCTPAVKKWYAIRATYGREKMGAEFMVSRSIEVFHPVRLVKKEVKGKRVFVEESWIPNIFFAFSTLDVLKEFIYNNTNEVTKNLRFYYAHHHDGTKEPLVVPQQQIDSMKIICDSKVDHVILMSGEVKVFKEGQQVIVTDGIFAGTKGVVARYQGQQRVGVVVKGLLTATTAYIPKAFLKTLPSE